MRSTSGLLDIGLSTMAIVVACALGLDVYVTLACTGGQCCAGPLGRVTVPSNCEDNIRRLDSAHVAAGTAGRVEFVARVGDTETSLELNRQRLHNVRTYLVEFKHRAPDTVTSREGQPLAGFGGIEVYVNGVLFDTLLARRNKQLLVGHCDERDRSEKRLYPWKLGGE